jgi:hypothetical protein
MENPGPACLDCVGLSDLEFLLLRTDMGAGDGGASGRFGRLDEAAIAYAFALWAAGWTKPDDQRRSAGMNDAWAALSRAGHASIGPEISCK